MVYQILVGSYTHRITTLAFDPSAKSLSVLSYIEAGYHPSWLAQHSEDESLIFATNEASDGKVQLFKKDEAGELTFLEETSSGGADPASLTIYESSAIVGNVCRFPLAL
jgi:6-phosphogluconolactonase (cycloisomerase 2 family)